MDVGIIITFMTCLFAVALTMGGPIKRQTSQSEKTVPIRGNVTLLCPFVPDVTWQYVYWKKNDYTIYSLEVKSNTPTTNDTRYESSDHATRLTINDLKKADSGIYHCKVATLATSDFIQEGGRVLLSVTDQEGGLFTTSPGFPVRASTSMPPKPPKPPNTFYLAFSITLSILIIIIIIIIITMCLVFKYRRQIAESRLVKDYQRRAPTRIALTPVPAAPNYEKVEQGSPANVCDQADIFSRAPDSATFSSLDASASRDPDSSSTPLLRSSTQAPTRIALTPVPAAPNPENVEEGTHTPLIGSDTHGTDDVDVDDRPDDSQAFAPTRNTPTPVPVARNLENLETAGKRETHLPLVGHLLMDDLRRASTGLVKDYMCEVLHSLMDLYGLDPPQQDGKYSSLKKYVWCIPKSVLANGAYLLDGLDHIPVGRKRDVCEILLTMPENQQVNLPMLYENKDIFIEYGQDDQGNTIEHECISRSEKLGEQMKTILSRSLTRDAARIFISLTILDSPVGNSGSVSFSQQADSTFNQSARETAQNTSVLSQRNGDSGCKDDNLIEFWLSKVIKLQPKVQRDIILKFGGFEQDAVQPSMETTTDPSIMRIPDAKELNKINVNESINQEKEMDPIDMQNVDAKTVKISNLKGSTDQEPQPPTSSRPPSTNSQLLSRKQLLAKIAESDETLASQLKDLIEKQEKEEKDKHEEKAIGCIDMQNYDAKEVKNANLNKSTELNKKSIEIHGEKEKG